MGSLAEMRSGLAGVVFTRGCGRFEMYSSVSPQACTLEGQEVPFDYEQQNSRLSVNLPLADNLTRELRVQF